LEAEESVLGGILLDNTAIDKVIEHLRAEDFYREAHAKIFRAMLDLTERAEPCDIVTLAEALKARGELEDVGGASYLAELADRVPTAANIVHYAKIVKARSVQRQLIRTATEIATRGYEAHQDVDEFVDEAEQLIFGISESRIQRSFHKLSDLIMESLKTVELLWDRKDAVTGVPTGYVDLDRLTAGFQPSDLIVIAGRPGMGKTALCLNIAANAALEHEIPVAIFSLEMSREQLAMRLLCSEARVNGAKVRSGYIGETDFSRLARAGGRLAEAPIFIDDTAGLSILELRAKARRLKRETQGKLGMVLVDYLQLMRGVGRADNREQEISEISRSLKALAKELNVPVVALSQLNRQVEGRGDKRPILADLRESGAIEQDADVIIFIYRPGKYQKDATAEEKGLTEIIVGKQRNGPTDSVELFFHEEYMRFDNYSRRPSQEFPAGESRGPALRD